MNKEEFKNLIDEFGLSNAIAVVLVAVSLIVCLIVGIINNNKQVNGSAKKDKIQTQSKTTKPTPVKNIDTKKEAQKVKPSTKVETKNTNVQNTKPIKDVPKQTKPIPQNTSKNVTAKTTKPSAAPPKPANPRPVPPRPVPKPNMDIDNAMDMFNQ